MIEINEFEISFKKNSSMFAYQRKPKVLAVLTFDNFNNAESSGKSSIRP